MNFSALAALATVLCSASALQAQEDLRLPVDLWTEPAAVAGDVAPWESQDEFRREAGRLKTDLTVNAAIHGRFSVPFGHGGIRLGPVGFTIGMGFRMLVPPNDGGNVSLNSGPLWVWDVDLGAELGC